MSFICSLSKLISHVQRQLIIDPAFKNAGFSAFLENPRENWSKFIEFLNTLPAPPKFLGLEDDVRKQVSEPRLFARELVSNGLDAGASKVLVNLSVEGLFKIQDDGSGISPVTFLRDLTVPKMSSKSALTTIGQFGMGFNLIFNYLNAPEDELILTTATPSLTYSVRYFFKDGDIFLDFLEAPHVEDLVLSEHGTGTSLSLRSAMFNEQERKEIQKILQQKFEFLPVEQLEIISAGPIEPLCSKRFVLTIRNIEILTFSSPEANICFVHWDLPPDTQMPESRNLLRMTLELRNFMIKKMEEDLSALVSMGEKVQYFNTVFLGLGSFFKGQSFLSEQDNPLAHLHAMLRRVIQEGEAISAQFFPDTPVFKSFAREDRFALNPELLAITDPDWAKKMGQPLPGWSGKTEIFLTPMPEGSYWLQAERNQPFSDLVFLNLDWFKHQTPETRAFILPMMLGLKKSLIQGGFFLPVVVKRSKASIGAKALAGGGASARASAGAGTSSKASIGAKALAGAGGASAGAPAGAGTSARTSESRKAEIPSKIKPEFSVKEILPVEDTLEGKHPYVAGVYDFDKFSDADRDRLDRAFRQAPFLMAAYKPRFSFDYFRTQTGHNSPERTYRYPASVNLDDRAEGFQFLYSKKATSWLGGEPSQEASETIQNLDPFYNFKPTPSCFSPSDEEKVALARRSAKNYDPKDAIIFPNELAFGSDPFYVQYEERDTVVLITSYLEGLYRKKVSIVLPENYFFSYRHGVCLFQKRLVYSNFSFGDSAPEYLVNLKVLFEAQDPDSSLDIRYPDLNSIPGLVYGDPDSHVLPEKHYFHLSSESKLITMDGVYSLPSSSIYDFSLNGVSFFHAFCDEGNSNFRVLRDGRIQQVGFSLPSNDFYTGGMNKPQDSLFDFLAYDEDGKIGYRCLTQAEVSHPNFLPNIEYLVSLPEFVADAWKFSFALGFAHLQPMTFQKMLVQGMMDVTDKTGNHDALYIPHSPKSEHDFDLFCDLLARADLQIKEKKSLIRLFQLLQCFVGHSPDFLLAKGFEGIIQVFGYEALLQASAWLYSKSDKGFKRLNFKYLWEVFPSGDFKRLIRENLNQKTAPALLYLLDREQHVLALQNLTGQRELMNFSVLIARYLVGMSPDQEQEESLDLALPRRLLNHALYKQSRPEDGLWLRELLQNAIDSTAFQKDTVPALIEMSIGAEALGEECVFQIRDYGVGMSFEEVLNYFCIPGASSKKNPMLSDDHRMASSGASAGAGGPASGDLTDFTEPRVFIGGRGIGVFTLFAGAKEVRLKTAKADPAGVLKIYEFCFVPIRDSDQINGQISDIAITFKECPPEKEGSSFKGTLIHRVSAKDFMGDQHLEMSYLAYSVHRHAQFVPDDRVKIFLHGGRVNEPYALLREGNIPGFGKLQAYPAIRSQSSAILCAGGLFISEIHEPFPGLPKTIRDALFSEGRSLIINFPGSLQLTRDRTDIQQKEEFWTFITPYLIQLCFEVYIKKLLNSDLPLSELPFDFFAEFSPRASSSDLISRRYGRDVAADAKRIQSGDWMSYEDFSIYQHSQTFYVLLSYLKIFKDCISPRLLYSLVDLREIFSQKGSIPRLVDSPLLLNRLISFSTGNRESALQQKKVSDEKGLKEVIWVPEDESYRNTPQFFMIKEILKKILEILRGSEGPPIRIGWSTVPRGEAAFTHQGVISHGAVDVFFQVLSRELIDAFKSLWSSLFLASQGSSSTTLARERLMQFSKAYAALVNICSHEFIHAAEEVPHDITHDQTFFDKQMVLLFKRSLALSPEKMWEECLHTMPEGLSELEGTVDEFVFINEQMRQREERRALTSIASVLMPFPPGPVAPEDAGLEKGAADNS